MTVEDLDLLAANLYKQAEEATPIVGGADKKDWMARRIELYIETCDPYLQDLLACENIDDVLTILDDQYKEFKDEDRDETADEVARANCVKGKKNTDLLNEKLDSDRLRATGDLTDQINDEDIEGILLIEEEPVIVEETILIIDDTPVADSSEYKNKDSDKSCGC